MASQPQVPDFSLLPFELWVAILNSANASRCVARKADAGSVQPGIFSRGRPPPGQPYLLLPPLKKEGLPPLLPLVASSTPSPPFGFRPFRAFNLPCIAG